jgi:putative pyruvate formate lyase activating enzyme
MYMLPSYLEKLSPLELQERANALMEKLESCNVCPNQCEVNRLEAEEGDCLSTDEIVVSSIGPHFGEEPPLVGRFGSGTIFLSSCNLDCVFCQNYDISHNRRGETLTKEELAEAMLALQSRGCHNINFVTPTHFTPQIVSSLILAVEGGLQIPLVYNCGGYESVDTLKLLDGIFDIYMPDIKYSDSETAKKYSGISNYWDVVKTALIEMNRQVGPLHISNTGIARKGLLIRHLVLPNDIAGSRKVFEFIAGELSVDSYVNIMDQYRPAFNAHRHPDINRSITYEEYIAALDYARELGLHRGFG